MKEFFGDSGLTGVEVRKLEPLQKWHENHEAFRVVVAYKHKDVLLSPDFWSDSEKVREWVYNSTCLRYHRLEHSLFKNL